MLVQPTQCSPAVEFCFSLQPQAIKLCCTAILASGQQLHLFHVCFQSCMEVMNIFVVLEICRCVAVKLSLYLSAVCSRLF